MSIEYTRHYIQEQIDRSAATHHIQHLPLSLIERITRLSIQIGLSLGREEVHELKIALKIEIEALPHLNQEALRAFSREIIACSIPKKAYS